MLQTVLIPREWGLRRARSWLRQHDYNDSKVDIAKNYYRFRQNPPVKGNYYTVKLPDGVDLVFIKK